MLPQFRVEPFRFGDFRDTLRERWAQCPHTTREDDSMGHLIRPVAKEAPKIVEVPEEVVKELGELLDYLEANKGQVAYAKFDTAGEVGTFMEQARSWAALHEPAVTFRKLPSKGLGEDELRFTVSIPKAKAEETAAGAGKAGK